ncbi:MAG TPA: thioredoxin family protein [Pyrinomonadaceae bacterium]|jgi:thiol:disulfide interchange protein|nr:thioredoxin family protein [Pyrinomonadaceae bacterium]
MAIMKPTASIPFLAFIFCAMAHVAMAQAQPATNPEVLDSVTPDANIYAANADANKEIAEALKRAATEKKRVLLVFGANWCYDCHVLDHALHEGEAGKILSENYLLVHVDIGEGEKNLDLVKLYKIPLERGVPALVVLKSDGSMIYWSGYGEFEAARKMMKKDLVAFLLHWTEKPK